MLASFLADVNVRINWLPSSCLRIKFVNKLFVGSVLASFVFSFFKSCFLTFHIANFLALAACPKVNVIPPLKITNVERA